MQRLLLLQQLSYWQLQGKNKVCAARSATLEAYLSSIRQWLLLLLLVHT
jgi:hypothetical protein